jgi:hypothetical protein
VAIEFGQRATSRLAANLLARPRQPSSKAERLRWAGIHTDAIWTGWRSLRSAELSPRAGRIDLGRVGSERGQLDREVVSNAEDQVQESDDGEHPERRREPGPCPAGGGRQAASDRCRQRLALTNAQPAVSISPSQPARFGVQSRHHAGRRSRSDHRGSSDWPPRASLHVPLL